jgi:hypothetical protein
MARGNQTDIKIPSLQQIGIAVKDIEETARNYWNILGIGPWEVCEIAPPVLHDISYCGKRGNYTMRAAFTTIGPVKIELLQRVSGSNLQRDLI